MRKVIATCSLVIIAMSVNSQEIKKNGTIYINHPYIKVVEKTVDAYLKKDVATNTQLYSDTAKFWTSGMKKSIPIKEAFAMWNSDFDYYDSVTVKPFGYPDYLEYDKDHSKVVQSWWNWSGKSKKTGEVVTIVFTQFDDFNAAGKITMEQLFGDFSKMVKE